MTTYEQFTRELKSEKNSRNYNLPEKRLFNSGKVMFIICLILTTIMVIFASSRG